MTEPTLRRTLLLGLLGGVVLPGAAFADKGGKKPKKAKGRGHGKGRGRGHEKGRGRGHEKHGDDDRDRYERDDVRYEDDDDHYEDRTRYERDDYRRRDDPTERRRPLTENDAEVRRTSERAELDAEYEREFATIKEDYVAGRLEIQRAFDRELDDGVPVPSAVAMYERRMADLDSRMDARYEDLDRWYRDQVATLD